MATPELNQSQSFFDRIQDPQVRQELAVFIATNGMFAALDEGAPFDDALATSLHLAIMDSALLENIALNRNVEETWWDEAEWTGLLDAAQAGERPDYEPGKVRKWLAAQVLRQELPAGNYVFDLAFWRKRSAMVQKGIVEF